MISKFPTYRLVGIPLCSVITPVLGGLGDNSVPECPKEHEEHCRFYHVAIFCLWNLIVVTGIGSLIFALYSLLRIMASSALYTRTCSIPLMSPPTSVRCTLTWESLFLTVAGDIALMVRYSIHVHMWCGDMDMMSRLYLQQNTTSSETALLCAASVPGALAPPWRTSASQFHFRSG